MSQTGRDRDVGPPQGRRKLAQLGQVINETSAVDAHAKPMTNACSRLLAAVETPLSERPLPLGHSSSRGFPWFSGRLAGQRRCRGISCCEKMSRVGKERLREGSS